MASEKERNSTYDFLYIDYERVHSFLNQRGEFHSLEGNEETIRVEKSRAHGGSIGLSKTNVELGTVNSSDRSKTFRYNTYWHNVFEFLDNLTGFNKSNRRHSINEIAMLTGKLSILDTEISKRYFDKASENFVQADSPKNDNEPNAVETAGLFSIMNGIFFSITSKGMNYWGFLKRDSILTDPVLLNIKYGLCVGKGWTCVSIIDIIPKESENMPHSRLIGTEKIMEENFMDILDELRKIVGKPIGFIGITPLLIFRKITT
uniref:Uncharacterized protein n=1 Tax=Candidatus Kentrum sp. FW TaxID=2126338 RepID=A0A450U4K2_9GAMM|nr:MAG: hypothetical protein BECKFW1821C_GA0114237_12003 [Candidatus Kentron sp. FW]